MQGRSESSRFSFVFLAYGGFVIARVQTNNLDYAHPMREDVKRKFFALPSGETRVW
jgi:hypothetical protein